MTGWTENVGSHGVTDSMGATGHALGKGMPLCVTGHVFDKHVCSVSRSIPSADMF